MTVMNPVMWIIIIVAAVIVWAVSSFIFIPLGKIIIKKLRELNEIMDYDDEDDDI